LYLQGTANHDWGCRPLACLGMAARGLLPLRMRARMRLHSGIIWAQRRRMRSSLGRGLWALYSAASLSWACAHFLSTHFRSAHGCCLLLYLPVTVQ